MARRRRPRGGFCSRPPASLVALCRWPWPLRLTASRLVLPLLFRALADAGTRHRRAPACSMPGAAAACSCDTHTHVLLFDTGDGWNTRGARMRTVVIAGARCARAQTVDVLVLPRLDRIGRSGAALLAVERGRGAHRRRWRLAGHRGCRRRRAPTRAFAGMASDFTLFTRPGRRYCVLRVAAGTHALLLRAAISTPRPSAPCSRVCRPGALGERRRPHEPPGERRWVRAVEWIEASARGTARSRPAGSPVATSRARARSAGARAGAACSIRAAMARIELGLGTQGIERQRMARSARYPFAWRRRRDALRRAPV